MPSARRSRVVATTWMVLLATAITLTSSMASAQCVCARCDHFAQYREANLCSAARADSCLERTRYTATRSDGTAATVGGVFRWRSARATGWRPGDPVRSWWHRMLLPHFTLEYMRKLRNAYNAAAQQCDASATCCAEREQLLRHLDDMIDFHLTDARNAVGGSGAPWAWENVYGITQGMEQLEWASFLASAAQTFQTNQEPDRATRALRQGLDAARALFLPVGPLTGGVRQATDDRCGPSTGATRPCYWFHSRGRGVDTVTRGPRTVLNQHLHVVRDALVLHTQLEDMAELAATAAGEGRPTASDILDAAVGGLYQLAFSAGPDDAAPLRAPALGHFVNPQGTLTPYVWAHYEFDQAARSGTDIGAERTCHYHFHTLEMLYSIAEHLLRNRSRYRAGACFPDALSEGAPLYSAMDQLLVRDGPVHRFYQSASSRILFAQQPGCPSDAGNPTYDLSAAAHRFYAERFGAIPDPTRDPWCSSVGQACSAGCECCSGACSAGQCAMPGSAPAHLDPTTDPS